MIEVCFLKVFQQKRKNFNVHIQNLNTEIQFLSKIIYRFDQYSNISVCFENKKLIFTKKIKIKIKYF